MILVAFAFIAAGYPLVYWGANNLKHWNRSIKDTDAAPLSLLFGVGSVKALRDADKLPIHPIPFPYNSSSSKTQGGAQPTGTGQGNGSQLSPNYPGGSGTIPTPPVGGINA